MSGMLRTEPRNEAEVYLLDILQSLVDVQSEIRTVDGGSARRVECTVEEFVLSNGGFWGPQRDDALCDGVAKNCHHNAQRYARTHEGVWYVEGFALGAVPVVAHHAWCIDDAGAVIDVTPGWCGAGRAYLGVVLPLELVDEHLRGNAECIGVIDNWEKGFPLLKLVGGKPQRVGSPFA